jgi:DNA-binding MarR family transcriptional regulator
MVEMENTSAPLEPEADSDVVDERLEVWERELPASLDLETEGIIQRIQWLSKHLERSMNETLSRFELSHGEWKALGMLRYSGPPYRLSPGKLASSLDLSSGAMTNRLDHLEEAGLVRRLPDPDDRRGLLVELTERGWQAWQETVEVQAEKEALVASVLGEDEKRQLNGLLRRLILAFPRQLPPAGG